MLPAATMSLSAGEHWRVLLLWEYSFSLCVE
jgi:hypothetical protein